MIVSAKELKRALTACAKVAPGKPSVEILSHVLIEANDQGCKLSVTDLEVSRVERLDAAVAPGEDWGAAVDVRSLLKLLPGKVADIKRAPMVELNPAYDDPGNLVIVAAGGVSTLRHLPAEDFPTLPTPDASSEVTDPAVFRVSEWRSMIGKVFLAISKGDSRFQLAGALLELNGRPRAVATDGHRLHRADGEYRVTPKQESVDSESWLESTLVPRQLLSHVQMDQAFANRKVQEQCGEIKSGKNKGKPKFRNVWRERDLYFFRSEHHLWIETVGVRYCGRILEGVFPDYDRVVKKGAPECEIIATAGDIRRALAAVAATISDDRAAVRLELSGEYPVFVATDPDKGTSSAELNGSTELLGQLAKLDTKEKAETSIGLNPDYLKDTFKPFDDSERVHLHLWDENTQGIVHVESDGSYRAVIMPIRL